MVAIEDRSFEEPEDDPFPSGETTPELKPLPSTQKYAFLDHHSANPVIISSQLDHDQEERLLAVLRASKEAMMRRDREVLDFTRYRVKNYSKLTNFRKLTRIEGYNGK